jgi:hypothetical protein
MKVLFAAIALAFSVNASAVTELVIYDGYTAPGKYQVKTVSTLENPASYAFLIPIEQGAYCFNGDVTEVPAIIEAMANSWNPYEITVGQVNYVQDETSVGEPTIIADLVLTTVQDGKTVLWTFPKLRPCNRVSKSK